MNGEEARTDTCHPRSIHSPRGRGELAGLVVSFVAISAGGPTRVYEWSVGSVRRGAEVHRRRCQLRRTLDIVTGHRDELNRD